MAETIDFDKTVCQKCDYMNMDIPISQKKHNRLCVREKEANCSVYTLTMRLKSRIDYQNGKCGPLFVCGKDGFIDTYNCPCD